MSLGVGTIEADRVRRNLGVGVVLGLGVGLAAIHVYHLVASGEEFISLLFGAVVPLALSLLLVLAGLWFPRTEYDDLVLRIGAWCVVGATLLFGISYVTIQYQRSVGTELANELFVLSANATGGAIVGFLIGVYDVDRKRTERRLTDEREMARQLSRRLTVLNRVLRHDIRNDVNVIEGNARLIIEGTSSPEAPARTIREKASKLHRMSESARQIESLLGREEIPTEPIDVATLLRTKALSLQRDHPYVDVDVDVPDAAWASANPMIESAVENVLENAVDHNDSEQPRLRASVERAGKYVDVRVADNGPGLPDDEIDVLEKGHETELEHASGLGLWLVNWIVTESGGEVVFEENDPRGSVVVIRLPSTEPPQRT
ncbi:MAG: sensor histidine kinase [Haloarculaceae archaeon]